VSVVKQIVFHPLIVAVICGTIAAAFHLHPPVAIDNTLQFLQGAAAPCAVRARGDGALRPFSGCRGKFPGIILVKLVLHPLIVFGLLMLFGPFVPECRPPRS